ncbi:MAG: ATP-binding protein [Deltaproteobacteria bacterium]|nr:MAG: ATP-binding protein [Deltaproteobacteria bacterium]
MADAVRGLFSSLESENALQAAVDTGREEDLYLEFKQKHNRSQPDVDEPDRKNLSKAVSAFANATGGVLVFGVETKKVQDGPDRAVALKPIANAPAFLRRLQESVLNTTQPVVDDVEFRCIPSLLEAGAGYVACLIPESDKTPHRAMFANREYWRRTTNGARRLEHIDLEDMFGRRPRPLLRAVLELRPYLLSENQV